MHYLITGHTGFKGSWLSLMLMSLGHEVSGISLNPEQGSLFEKAKIAPLFSSDLRIDIRNSVELKTQLQKIKPDFVFHLAAQPLVRHSYKHPVETFETNVVGTFNLLNAVHETESVRAQLIVTTDKVYKNVGQLSGYVESDILGGSDPYSSSKAAADQLTQEWARTVSKIPIGVARAGNVIGGGDVCEDRLIPDLVRAATTGKQIEIRNPASIRPWQHVLDCLAGYLKLSDQLLRGDGAGVWNFSSDSRDSRTVQEVVNRFAKSWGTQFIQTEPPVKQPHEAGILLLNSEKSNQFLNWNNKYDFNESVDLVVDWEKRFANNADPLVLTNEQIAKFFTK